MRRILSKRWFQALTASLAILCLAVLFLCWRYRIWSYADYRVYKEVARYPIGDDLWFGHIKAGDYMDEFTKAHPPHRIGRYGRFTEMIYYVGGPPPSDCIVFESMSVIAVDGRLVHAVAGGCTWYRAFFEMSREQVTEYTESMKRHLREKGIIQ
jgi:hypothetical protein